MRGSRLPHRRHSSHGSLYQGQHCNRPLHYQRSCCARSPFLTRCCARVVRFLVTCGNLTHVQFLCGACHTWKPVSKKHGHECNDCHNAQLLSALHASLPPSPPPSSSPPPSMFGRPSGCIEQLTTVERAAIVTLHGVGWTGRDIAQELHCSENSVSLWLTRWQETRSLEDSDRSTHTPMRHSAAALHSLRATADGRRTIGHASYSAMRRTSTSGTTVVNTCSVLSEQRWIPSTRARPSGWRAKCHFGAASVQVGWDMPSSMWIR